MTIDFTGLYSCINKAYHEYLEDYRRYQIYKGGAGAGKSVFISQKIIYNICCEEGFNVLCVRKVSANNHDSNFAELNKCINEWDLSKEFKINKSKGNEEIVFLPNGNKILFRGLDDPEKIKSITFETGDLVCVWIEEASEISEDDLKALNLRLRGISELSKHIILSFNPIDSDHWIKKRFFDNRLEEEDGYICETTYLDNMYLDEEYKAELEGLKDLDYYYYMVYALNQWGKRTGASVFENIEVHDFDIPENDYSNMCFGMDFGFNHANTLMGTGYIDGELYIFTEFYYKRMLNKDFIQSVDNSKRYEKSYPITSESAEPDKVAEWAQAGFDVRPARKGKGSLMEGINYLKSLPKIHIHKSNCPNAAREFLNFKYKQLKDGTILDEVVEIDDDTIAAVRYGNEHLFQTKNVKPVFTKGLF